MTTVLENGLVLESKDLKFISAVDSYNQKLVDGVYSSPSNDNKGVDIVSALTIKTLIGINLPATKLFIEDPYEGIPIIVELLEYFENKPKKFMKYLQLFEFDAARDEKLHTNSYHKRLLKILGGDLMIRIMQKVHARELSVHNFVANLFRPNLNEDDPEGLCNFIIKILEFPEHDLFTLLQFANYKKIRYAKNKKEMLRHAEYINSSKSGEVIVNKVQDYNLELLKVDDYTTDSQFMFTKQASIVNTVGSETNCCFRAGGIAGKLLKPAINSPIAGILHGNFRGRFNSRWFSFVWEYVEAEETGAFSKNLVLDNLEASGFIDNEEAKHIRNNVVELGSAYKSVKLGTQRNDINTDIITNNNLTIVNKRTPMIEYVKSFSTTYDDSKTMYTLTDSVTNDETVTLSRMNNGDLRRALYIESTIYGEDSDIKDLLKLDMNKELGYVIQSNQYIFGYLLTRVKYFYKENTTYNFSDEVKLSTRNKILYEHNLSYDDDTMFTKVLFIEDIFLQKYKHVVKSMRFIKDDMINWCKEHKISVITACTNEFSRPFTKHLVDNDAGIKYIEISPPKPTPIVTTDTAKWTKVDPTIKLKNLDVKL